MPVRPPPEARPKSAASINHLILTSSTTLPIAIGQRSLVQGTSVRVARSMTLVLPGMTVMPILPRMPVTELGLLAYEPSCTGGRIAVRWKHAPVMQPEQLACCRKIDRQRWMWMHPQAGRHIPHQYCIHLARSTGARLA